MFFVHHASFQIQLCVLKTNAVSLTIICYHLNGKQFFKGGQALSMISKKKMWLKIAIAMGSQSAHSNNRRESNCIEL